MGVRVVFFPDCPLILFLLKYKDVGAFLNKKKMRNSNRESPLNNSIDRSINRYRRKIEDKKPNEITHVV